MRLSFILLVLSIVGIHCIFAQDINVLRKQFVDPPLVARPKALWPWVNGNFSFSAITYEMEEAKEKGMGGFDIWDVGTVIDADSIVPDGPAFLSDESLNGIAHAVKEANRLGLELGLITSSSWNAGGSWVKPEHGAMGLFRSDTIVNGPVQFKGKIPFPIIPKTFKKKKMLLQQTNDGLPVYYREVALLLHPVTRDSIINSADVVLLPTIKNSSDEVTVSIPKGKYRIVRYVCAPTGQPLAIPSPKSNGLMLDHFSAEAQEANMSYVISRLKTKIPVLKDQSLKYFYEDSYEVNSAVWTPSLPEYFKKARGYDLIPNLVVLDGFTVNNTDITRRIQFDFNKVLSDLIIENHYAKGTAISAKEGLGFYAEAGGPGKPIHNVPFEDLKALGALTVPRGEFWNKHPRLDLLQIVKGISSAAHIYNQTFVEAEAFTSVYLWQEGPDELKPLADRALCEGLNRFVYHTFPHTTPEAGKPGWLYNFGTLINTTNGWWPKSNAFHQYLGRCSFLLQQGHFRGDVAFYYGDEAPNFVGPKHIPQTLGTGYDYDVVNTDVILNRMQVKDGKIFLPHGQFYEALVLPQDERIDPQVLQKVELMIQQGATVIGNKPKRSYSYQNADQNDKLVKEIADRVWGNVNGKEKNYGKGKIVWNKTVREVLLAKSIGPDVEFLSKVTHDSCDFIHRSAGEEEIFFIRNKSRKPFTGSIKFRVVGKNPEWWNPVSGSTYSITDYSVVGSNSIIPVQLEGEESAFIVFTAEKSKPQSARTNLLNTSVGPFSNTQNRSFNISTPWQVRFEHKSGEPTQIVLDQLRSLHTISDSAVKYFSGLAVYTTSFTLSKDQLANSNLILALNNVREIADVYLNGAKLGTHWHHTQRFNVTPYIRGGENILTVEVVNSINNALIGDAKRPKEFRFYKSNIAKLPTAWSKPFAEASLLPAGLVGPVKLYLLPKE